MEAAARLTQRRGYHATGVNDVVAGAAAPAGSLYFHFPGGKQELAAAAVDLSRDRIAAAAARTEAADQATALTDYVAALAATLERSGWECGCPVATVTLDVASESEQVRASCAGAYRAWHEAIADRLQADGTDAAVARGRATLALSAIQGALVLARAWQDTEPLETVGRELADLMAAA